MRSIVKLALNYVNEDDCGVIAPCGIICLGCDGYQDESLQAVKKVIEIWEGMNLPDVSGLVGLKAQDIYRYTENTKRIRWQKREGGTLLRLFRWRGTLRNVQRCEMRQVKRILDVC